MGEQNHTMLCCFAHGISQQTRALFDDFAPTNEAVGAGATHEVAIECFDHGGAIAEVFLDQ